MAAGRIKGITIEIGGDSTKLVKALSSVDNAISKTQQNLRDINRALKLDPSNVNLIKDKQKELANEIENTKKKLETEKEALSQMKSTEGFDANSRAARDLQIQIDLDTAALKELENQAKQSSSIIGQQFQVAGQKIQAVGDKIKDVGDKIAGIGQGLTTKVTAPIVGAFGASVKAAVDWETAFTGVRKTVNGTEEDFAQLSDNIKKMATETASSKEDIAGVMEIAGQLGIEGVDNLTNFTKTMVELGDTTNLTAEDAATALARFMNITGESISNVDKIGASIVDLGNNFATTESEIVEMSTRLASAGTIAGLSSTDILALSTAMSSVGIQAEAGGTAMSQTLKTIATEVAAFKDGEVEGLEVIANVAQMSAEDFAKAWEGDPITAIQSFVTGLSQVKDEGENVFAVLGEMGMTGIRQTNMLQSLALASEMLGDAVNVSTEAYEENTALTDEANKRYATMAAKISQLKERFKEVAINVGEILMPYVEKLMDKIEGLIEKWNGLDDSQKETIIKMAAIAAAIGPVLLIVGKLVSSVGSIISVGGKLISGIGTLMTNLGGIQGVLAALTGPIGIVVAAVAALATGFIYLFNTNDEFRASILKTVESLKENFAKAMEAVKPQLEALGNAFNTLMEVLAPAFEAIFQFIVAWISGIIETISPIVEVITNIIEFITNIIQAFIALLKGDTEGFMQYMSAAVQNFLNAITGIFKAIVAFWIGFFKSFGVDLKQVFNLLWEAIKIVVSNAITSISEGIQEKWNAIGEWLEKTLIKIHDFFAEIFDKMKEAVSEKITGIKDTIVEGITAAVDFVKELPEKFYNWGSEMITNLIDGIKEKISGVGDAIGGVAETIASYIHFTEPDVGPLSDFHTFMPDMINEMITGINKGIPRLENAMNSLGGAMASTLQGNGMTGNTIANNISINVYGAQGQNVSELADIIEQRIAEHTIRRGVAGI